MQEETVTAQRGMLNAAAAEIAHLRAAVDVAVAEVTRQRAQAATHGQALEEQVRLLPLA